MADQDEHPLQVDTANLNDDCRAVHRQLTVVAQFRALRTREFAFEACRAVGQLFCRCDAEPQPLEGTGSREQKVAAARAHPGTCGVHTAGVIAGVETEDFSGRPRSGDSRPP